MDEAAARAILFAVYPDYIQRFEDGVINIAGSFDPIELEAIGHWFKLHDEWPKP